MWFMLRCRRDWTGRRTSPPTFVIRTIATLVIQMLLLFSHQHYIIIRTFINTPFSRKHGRASGCVLATGSRLCSKLLKIAASLRAMSFSLCEISASLNGMSCPLSVWSCCSQFSLSVDCVTCPAPVSTVPRAKVIHNPSYILIMKAAQSIQPRYFCNQMVPKETDIFLAIYMQLIGIHKYFQNNA